MLLLQITESYDSRAEISLCICDLNISFVPTLLKIQYPLLFSVLVRSLPMEFGHILNVSSPFCLSILLIHSELAYDLGICWFCFVQFALGYFRTSEVRTSSVYMIYISNGSLCTSVNKS